MPAEVGENGCFAGREFGQRRAASAVAVLLCACNQVLGITPPSEHRGDSASHAECATSDDCLPAGSEFEPRICRARECVPLTHSNCPLVLPLGSWSEQVRTASSEPVIVGLFVPVSPSTIVTEDVYVVDLALSEFSKTLGALPAPAGGSRPIVALACRDDYASRDEFDGVLDHLLEVVEVPAIISALRPDDLAYAFQRSASRHVFYWNTQDADPSLRNLLHDGLLWHALPGFEDLASTYAALLDRTILHLARTEVLEQDEPVKVALVATVDHPSLSTLSGALRERLIINGKSPTENVPGYFREVQVESSADKLFLPDYGPAVAELRDFGPDIVIAAAADEFLSFILPALEARMRPFYLLSPLHLTSGALEVEVRELRGNELSNRIAGVTFAAAEDDVDYMGFQERFDSAYSGYVGRAFPLGGSYDATYYLLYSAVSARDASVLMGPDLTLGVRALLSGGRTFGVGPEHLLEATGELARSGRIILNGTLGRPNFDPATGARRGKGSVWCIDANQIRHLDALRLEDAGTLVGTLPCFDF